MKTEIKFRVWNGDIMEHQIMAGFLGAFYVQGIDENDSASMSPFNTKYDDNVVLMPSLGRKDKDGKDVYDGDIVKTRFLKHSERDLRLVQSVVYDPSLCSFVLQTGIGSVDLDIEESYNYCPVYWANEIEVIGNIYENPELI